MSTRRREGAVRPGHLRLVVEVRAAANAAQDGVASERGAGVHDQPFDALHGDAPGGAAGELGDAVAQERQALVDGEERLLGRVVGDAHGDALEQERPASDQVEVSAGGRIEGAGEEGVGRHGLPF